MFDLLDLLYTMSEECASMREHTRTAGENSSCIVFSKRDIGDGVSGGLPRPPLFYRLEEESGGKTARVPGSSDARTDRIPVKQ